MVNSLGKAKANFKFSNTPIIICGCGRSGTTLLLSIMGAHPRIYALSKETTAFSNWKNKNNSYVPLRLDRFYRDILLHKVARSVTRWCEKTPKNVREIDKIINYFNDDILLIHIIRDGRDVMLSRHPVDPNQYWISPERWINDVKAGLKYKDHPKMLTIKYEDLILNYRDKILEICNFISEECTDEMYNWFKHTNITRNKAWNASVQQLHYKSIGKWKNKENEQRVEEIMSNGAVVALLIEFNYL